jgi:hypothetical protein
LDRAIILNQLLLKIGGSGLDDQREWASFTDPRAIDFLLERGRQFSTAGLECLTETPFPDWRKPLSPNECHRNCIDLRSYLGTAGRSEYVIVHGWALSSNDIWYCHSWCLRRIGPKNIIETTPRRVAYFGFILPDEIDARVLHWGPSGLGGLLEEYSSRLVKQIRQYLPDATT